MTDYLLIGGTILTGLMDILILEFIIITGKIIYDDFFKKSEVGFMKLDDND